VRGTADGYLIALDMDKGTLLWSQKIADVKSSQYLSMPAADLRGPRDSTGRPALTGGEETGSARSSSRPGEPVWRFNLIPERGRTGVRKAWKDPKAREHGGAA